MSWRGKYRGRGKGTVVYSNTRSKAAISAVIQPPPLYPPLTFRPLPLRNDEESKHLLKIKREFRQLIQNSEYYLKFDAPKKDIERYSDRYNSIKVHEWQPDFSYIPEELRIQVSKKRKVKPQIKDENYIHSLFQKLESKETNEEHLDNENDEEEKTKKVKRGEEDEVDEEDEDDEEEDYCDPEEDNDYTDNYFNNGEENENDSDDNDGGGMY